MKVGNLMQSSKSSAQIQLAPNLSVSDLPQALAVPQACGCQGTLTEPLSRRPTWPSFSSGPSTTQETGILHAPAAFVSLPVLLTLRLHPGRRPGVTANQQKPERGSLALSPPPTPAGGQAGILTRPEHKGGSSGKPGDRVPQSCSPCLPKCPPLLCLLGKPSCLQAMPGSWGALSFPSLFGGHPPYNQAQPSLAPDSFWNHFLGGSLQSWETQDRGSEDLCALPTSATNSLGDLERLGLGFPSCSHWTILPFLTLCTVLCALQLLPAFQPGDTFTSSSQGSLSYPDLPTYRTCEAVILLVLWFLWRGSRI